MKIKNEKNSIYYKQVQLLVQVLPLLDSEKCFALKGGTAINLFFRELPRLSVDIDLLYLPSEGREESLKNIRAALTRLSILNLQSFKMKSVIQSQFWFSRLVKIHLNLISIITKQAKNKLMLPLF